VAQPIAAAPAQEVMVDHRGVQQQESGECAEVHDLGEVVHTGGEKDSHEQ